MPTYEYQCHQCGKKFEEFQSISSEPFFACPKCLTKVKRSISGGMGVIFKGSGFYLTDYKNKKTDKKDSHVSSHSKESGETKKEKTAVADKSKKVNSSEK